MLTLAAAASAADGPGQETYVVRHGDTLSKIAARVFGDAGRWREILEANPQVTNANRIYPGDSLLVPVPQTAAQAGDSGGLAAREDAGAAPEAGAGQAPAAEGASAAADATLAGGGVVAVAEALVPDLPVEQVRAVPVVNPVLYSSAGYIADNLPALAIIATQDERIMLAAGDVGIINAPVEPGRRFTVVRADRRVFHPLTGGYLGWLTRVLGTAEVTCRDELTSTVVLHGMRDAATIGDYLVPFDPDDVLEENVLPGKLKPGCVAAGPAEAVIVAFDEERLAVGEQEFAYIDRGITSCVVPGKRFTIYRETYPGGRMAIGELQVLRAGERTAAALITTSVQEVQVGNLLRSR